MESRDLIVLGVAAVATTGALYRYLTSESKAAVHGDYVELKDLKDKQIKKPIAKVNDDLKNNPARGSAPNQPQKKKNAAHNAGLVSRVMHFFNGDSKSGYNEQKKVDVENSPAILPAQPVLTKEEIEQQELEVNRAQLFKDLADIPIELQCPVSLEMLENPRMTPQGQCFSEVEIKKVVQDFHRCPITNQPLTLNDLSNYQPITDLIADEKTECDALSREIKAMTQVTKDKVNNQFDAHKINQRKRANRIEHMKVDFALNHLKEKLKIDSKNIEHLTYWHRQTKHCFHGFGGVEIKHDVTGRIFRVPTRVRRLMEVANTPFESAARLMDALNLARVHKPHWWNNPFSHVTRSPTTQRVYVSPNLNNLQL